jgi:cytochrome c oxidase accessory protein FixG
MAKKSDYLKGWIPYRIKRYWAYVAITIIALVLPWIKINGNHFFLLNFDQKQLHFLFTRFDMQELYIMPFLLMMLFLGIFALTAFAGRAWCGWACPQTIFRVIYRDLLETKILKIRKNIKNKQKEPDYTKGSNGVKRAIAIAIWSLLSLIAAADFMWYFVPPETFFKYLANPSEHTVMIGFVVGVALFLVADIVFIKENFCIYICPYSRVQSVLFDEDTIMAVYDPIRGGKIYEGHGEEKHKVASSQKELLEKDPEAECTMCESCVRVCPTHIDIRKGLQLECINCLECVDACTTVMGALNKPSLVQWSSERETERHAGKTRYFRPKIIGYFSVLALVVVMMFVMGSKKEGMLLNINKDTRLYKVLDNGQVENSYLGLFQNTDSKKHTYTFTVDNKDIEIVTPKDPFSLGARAKRKKVIILRAKKPLIAPDAKKDAIIHLNVNAFATDDKKKINIFRKIIFVYPTKEHLEEERGK